MSSLSEELSTYAAVVLTGGSSGIGKSFIEAVSKLHPTVLVCNLSRRVPAIISSELNLRHIPCDLSKNGDISSACDRSIRILNETVPSGRILLINNSGFGAYGRFPEPNLEHQLEMLDVNVRALVEVTGRFLPLLRARGGAVMNIASTAAFQPTAHLATYGATKAFVLNWTLALNEELRGTGVRALAVCPGPTSTDFFRRAGLSQGTVPDVLGQTSERVVHEALVALANGRSLVVTGWKNKVLAAVSSKLPKAFGARLAARILERVRRPAGGTA